MKIIIFVHTCKIYEETRSKLIEDTWGKNKDNVVFITDNENSTLKNNIYIGPYKKGPTYHPENVIKMFNLFLSNYDDYDFYMIIDDDTYLYIDKLKSFLSYFDKNISYMIGDFLNWPYVYNKNHANNSTFVGDYTDWIGGGPGIVFTKKCIISYLALIKQFNIPYINHDVWLHKLYNLSNKKIHNIQRIHCPGFHQYGAEELYKQYDTKSNYLISIHLNHNLNLIDKYNL